MLLVARHRRQVTLLLLIVAAQVDRCPWTVRRGLRSRLRSTGRCGQLHRHHRRRAGMTFRDSRIRDTAGRPDPVAGTPGTISNGKLPRCQCRFTVGSTSDVMKSRTLCRYCSVRRRPAAPPVRRSRRCRWWWGCSSLLLSIGRLRNISITGAKSAALVIRSVCPPGCKCRVACGSSAAMIRALATGMIGSSVPATISVSCRISGSAKTLVHTDPANNWYT